VHLLPAHKLPPLAVLQRLRLRVVVALKALRAGPARELPHQ
jgi:hypothetical protein